MPPASLSPIGRGGDYRGGEGNHYLVSERGGTAPRRALLRTDERSELAAGELASRRRLPAFDLLLLVAAEAKSVVGLSKAVFAVVRHRR